MFRASAKSRCAARAKRRGGHRAALATAVLSVSAIAAHDGRAAAEASAAGDAQHAAFAVRDLAVTGRPIEAVTARFDPATRGHDLVIATAAGAPPDERRWIAIFRASRLGPDTAAAREMGPADTARPDEAREIAPEVVGFDVGRVAGEPGERLLLLAPGRLHVVSPGLAGKDGAQRELALVPPAPLPPRARGLTRLALATPDGRAALVPSLEGVRVVPFDGGAAREIALPSLAEYETAGAPPRFGDEWMTLHFAWPVLAWADEDGDGREDLFALARFGMSVVGASDDGLALRPTRTRSWQPFTPAEELRPEATSLRLVATDFDGDGRADVMLHRNAGTLLRSRSRTEIELSSRAGALVSEESDALVATEARDLDGDGRAELAEGRIDFGIVQLARVLATRRVLVELRARVIPAAGEPPEPRTSWREDVVLDLDFERGRVTGLFPTVAGDWNGDGRRDLLLGRSDGTLVFRPGIPGAAGPAFGEAIDLPGIGLSGLGRVADLDGDGLDDLVLYDPRDESGRVRVLRNLGRLPGTPAGLRRAEDGSPRVENATVDR